MTDEWEIIAALPGPVAYDPDRDGRPDWPAINAHIRSMPRPVGFYWVKLPSYGYSDWTVARWGPDDELGGAPQWRFIEALFTFTDRDLVDDYGEPMLTVGPAVTAPQND